MSESLLTGRGFDLRCPGIERPLKYPWQYAKHLGRQVRLRRKGTEAVEEITGTLTSLEESGVSVRSGREGPVVVVPFESIIEARIAMPW